MNELRRYLTPLNLMFAGVLLLLGFDLGLATKLAIAWHQASSDQSAEYESDMATYAQLQAQMGHLRGMPARINGSHTEAERFIAARIPSDDSTILAELGEISGHDHVRLSRAQYTPVPAVQGLVELRVDASVTGEYGAIMHFINDLERDKNHAFFIIRNVTLTGQQGGIVNLRLRMTTYMRADAASTAVLANASRSAAEVQ